MLRKSPTRRLRARWPRIDLQVLEDRQLLSVVHASRDSATGASRPAEVRTLATGRPHHPWKLFASQPALAERTAGDRGAVRVSTIDIRARNVTVYSNGTTPPSTAFTPARLSEAYSYDNVPQQGAGMTIAIVDGYDDPNITSDLATFSAQFGLPQMDGLNGDPTFTKAMPQGVPAANSVFSLEIAVDVEWAHAMAPLANILLVEALDRSDANLYAGPQSAEDYAVSQPGVEVVSNSFGAPEYPGEILDDGNFLAPPGHSPVAVLASTGDNGAPGQYPAYSPNVLAVGGTTLSATSSGLYLGEQGWSRSGGGVSLYESKPSYQVDLPYAGRSIPDVASDADQSSGVAVYDSYGFNGWLQIGGTSVACPTWAALVARADEARIDAGLAPLATGSVQAALYSAYDSAAYAASFHDIEVGNNGNPAKPGYDLVTGIGSPRAPQIVGLLSAPTISSPT